jgi:hypothetical protein
LFILGLFLDGFFMNIAIAQSAVGKPVDLTRLNQPDMAVVIDPGADK